MAQPQDTGSSAAASLLIGQLQGALGGIERRLGELVESQNGMRKEMANHRDGLANRMDRHQEQNDTEHEHIRKDIAKLRAEVDVIKSQIAELKKGLETANAIITRSWSPVERLASRVLIPLLAALYADHTTGAHVHKMIEGFIK